MTFPVTGATYRLKLEVRRKLRITLDVEDHETAKLVEHVKVLGNVVVLDRKLAGSLVWTLPDLAWVHGAKEPKRQEQLPLQFRSSLLPAQRRQLLQGESHGNLDFGFTPEQAKALDELEDAIKSLNNPALQPVRARKRYVLTAYQEVLKLNLKNALTEQELLNINRCFGNTVL